MADVKQTLSIRPVVQSAILALGESQPLSGYDALAAAFSPAGEDYAFYDFTDTTRLFPTGGGSGATAFAYPTIGSAIGVIVGKEKAGRRTLSEIMAAMPELILNGKFDTDTIWVKGSGWSIAGGLAVKVPSGVFSPLTQSYAFAVGKNYLASYDLALTAGTMQMTFINNTVGGVTKGGSGSFVDIVKAVAGNNTLRMQANETANLTLDNVSLKELPAHIANQSTASLMPQYQLAGAKFDGSDDTLLTDMASQAGANSIIAQITVPSSITTNQIVAGAYDITGAQRYQLGFTSAGGGVMQAGLGNTTESTIKGGPDLRGTTAVVCLTCDGATVNLIVNGVVVYTGAQSGTPAIGTALRIGSRNASGTSDSTFGGNIKRIAIGRKALTLAQAKAIAQQWA